MDKAEEVFDVVLPSGDEAAEVVHPGEEPFHSPAPFVASQLSPILRLASAPTVGRDHFDAVLVGEHLIERVRIVGFVADQLRREFVEEASGRNLFHKLGQRLVDPCSSFGVAFKQFLDTLSIAIACAAFKASAGGRPRVTTCDFNLAQVLKQNEWANICCASDTLP